MELKAIEQLVEKYLEAETSLQEERELQAYFSSDNVAPHLQEYIPMFAYFDTSKEEKYSRDLTAGLDFLKNNSERGTPQVQQAFEGRYTGRRKVFSWVAVAASIVLMAGVFLQETPGTTEFGSYDDPQVAMEETKRALEMVSQLMNSGNENLGYLNEFNTTKDKLLK